MTDTSLPDETSAASGWRTIRKVAPYLWPEDNQSARIRVVAAMTALVLANRVVDMDQRFVELREEMSSMRETINSLQTSEHLSGVSAKLVALIHRIDSLMATEVFVVRPRDKQ